MLEQATLAGGCFWCLEAVFRELIGIHRVESGYAGGDMPNPSYQAVCSGETGHAEVVRVEFDTRMISFRELLEVFFAIHDPTTLNRQGADIGSQYRSAIFYHDDEQQRVARQMISGLERAQVFSSPVVTEIVPLNGYFPAETYHQSYFENHGRQPYCQAVIAPKLAKFRALFAARLQRRDKTA